MVHQPAFLSLYARLGVLTLSKDQLLAQLLLPRWHQLPDPTRNAVLRCVQNSWLVLKGNSALVSALGKTPFVITGALLCRLLDSSFEVIVLPSRGILITILLMVM